LVVPTDFVVLPWSWFEYHGETAVDLDEERVVFLDFGDQGNQEFFIDIEDTDVLLFVFELGVGGCEEVLEKAVFVSDFDSLFH